MTYVIAGRSDRNQILRREGLRGAPVPTRLGAQWEVQNEMKGAV